MPHFCISRTDNLGDVILTLPLAGFLKGQSPDHHVSFIGKSYTKAIIENCPSIDEFIDLDHLKSLPFSAAIDSFKKMKIDYLYHIFPNSFIAKLGAKSRIKSRIGTSHRLFHWWTCNQKLSFSRKNSDLHEAQLNFELLKIPFETIPPSLSDLIHLTQLKLIPPSPNVLDLVKSQKTIIIHPKSKGSAVEWGLDNFKTLSQHLLENGFQVIYTGSAAEKTLIGSQTPIHQNFKNTCGELSLTELISLIQHSQGLVACSTGPLHIAAACGIHAFGLFSTQKPIHPGRWEPLGKYAKVIVHNEQELPGIIKNDNSDVSKITPSRVLDTILNTIK